MPAQFGPSILPDRSEVSHAEVAAISFETTGAAAKALLPRFFDLTDTPVVSVTRIDYHDVDYLGGRGYREIVVAVTARHGAGDKAITAGFAPVMWVSEVGALISGREFMGFAKLPGEMAPMAIDDDARGFTCAEYGAPLIDGRIERLKPLSPEALARVNQGAAAVWTMGWKLIPGAGADGQAELDHPMANLTRWTYRRAWSGEGRVTFHRPSRKAAPLSAQVMEVLAALPVKAWRRAFAAEGSVVIDRTATRRLDREGA